MNEIKAFAAGFVSTLVFHQGVFALFYAAGMAPAPYDLSATAPLGVPAVVSLAFWGGLWGILIWWLIRGMESAGFWISAILFGAVGPSAVALFIVFPLKGRALAGGWDPQIITGALILNAAWGFGLALLLRLLRVRARS